MLVVSVVLDILAYRLTQHVPEDAVFNLGPTLGLMKEGRMVDLLVYKEFDTYYGYPPLFFVLQAAWYTMFGVSSSTVWGLVVFVHAALLAGFLFCFRYHTTTEPSAYFAVASLSSVYYLSGRPDPIALTLIFLLIYCLDRLLVNLRTDMLRYAGLLLFLMFFIHPLAFALSGLVTFGSLALQYGRSSWKVLSVWGIAVCASVMIVYAPFVLSDVASWKALFLGLAKNQERFKLASFLKFVGLNTGAFLVIGYLVLMGGRKRLGKLLINRLFLVSCFAMALPFLWGMSYYFLFVFPFLLASVLYVYSDSQGLQSKWRHVALIICCIAGLYQGSLGKIIQGIRSPEYGKYLNEARETAGTKIPRGLALYADSQLIADLCDYPHVNLLWHGMKYYRPGHTRNSVFAFSMDQSWDSNIAVLGPWTDKGRYEVIFDGERVSGLPALYRLGSTGSALQLRIISTRVK